jgi:hypothetical protein
MAAKRRQLFKCLDSERNRKVLASLLRLTVPVIVAPGRPTLKNYCRLPVRPVCPKQWGEAA